MRRINVNGGLILSTLIPAALVVASCGARYSRTDNVDESPAVAVYDVPAMESSDSDSVGTTVYLIYGDSAGPFSLSADFSEALDGFEVDKSTESRRISDGMTIEVPVYTYYIGNEGWVRVTPRYDPDTGQVSGETGEIYIYSELFLTDEGIGAMSSLLEFASVYTDMTIRYVGEYDMFAAETAQLPDVQFLFKSEHYIGTEHDSDSSIRSKLDLSDFDGDYNFYAVRLCRQ